MPSNRTTRPDPAALHGAAAAAPGDGHKRRGTLLIVDDDRQILDRLQALLELDGYDILAAHDGREAVWLFADHGRCIRMVLLDVSMPTMDGEEAFRHMRTLDGSATVVMMGSEGTRGLLDRLEHEGIAGFIAKPFRPHEVTRTVRRVLDARSGSNGSTARAARGPALVAVRYLEEDLPDA